jgi:hypothetical protein
MAYEMFEPKTARTELLSPTLAIAPKKLVLNARATRIFAEEEIGFVHILWDRHSRGVALRAAKKGDPNAYRVSFDRNNRAAGIEARLFLRHVGWSHSGRVTVPLAWNSAERMLEGTLPSEHLRIGKAEASPKLRKK